MRRLTIAIGLMALLGNLIGSPLRATAAFPGANGRIVFTTTDEGKPIIASMTSTGTNMLQLTFPEQSPTSFGDQSPRWSPGGKYVVFTRNYGIGYGDIWSMNADGSGQKRLTFTAGDDDWASFSPDGSRIVFTSDRDGNFEIYSMKVDGSDVRRLTVHPAVDLAPSWSPNNDRIAFGSNRRGVYEIHTMNPDGSGVARETTGSGTGDVEQQWSPDGAFLYFTRYGPANSTDIWKVNVASNVASPVVAVAAVDNWPAPAPNQSGTYELVYTTLAVGQNDIAVRRDSAYVNITAGYADEAWQPDWQPVPDFPLVDARFSNFEDDIVWVYDQGITTGCSAERYCPNDPVTREQMASFLVRALGLSGTPPDAFTDDESSTHEHNINLLAQAGITTGCGPALFCPKGLVKRDQMASFLARAVGLTGNPPDAFTDDEGNTHEVNINRIAAAGITTGCAANLYCPSGLVTRGQMAAFMHRAFD